MEREHNARFEFLCHYLCLDRVLIKFYVFDCENNFILDGYYEQYKIKVEQYNLDDSFGDVSEDVGFRSGARSSTRTKSRKRTPQIKQKVIPSKRRCNATHERMIDGVELKLYEIKQ